MKRQHQPRQSCARIPQRVLAVRRTLPGLFGLSLALAGCNKPFVLDPEGAVGRAENMIIVDTTIIMLAIVVPTIIGLLAFAWWFRASNTRATYLPEWTFSGRVEVLDWTIPLLTIMLLGSVAWIGSHDLDPAKPLDSRTPPLEVQVISLDWKWLFIYPHQGIATVNQLFIPSATPIHFSLTSASVLNAFFIPQLGTMIYTMNGMTTQLFLVADRPGVFYGLSSHFSGDGFSDMHFEVHALGGDQFEKWVKDTRNAGSTLDSNAYIHLSNQSSNVAPHSYGGVAPGLFEKIVSQKLPPGPGPRADRAGASVSPRTEN